MPHDAKQWKFKLQAGHLEIKGKSIQHPFEYIEISNYLVRTATSKIPKLGIDYSAYHTQMQTAVTQLWGKRYLDQQDSFAVGFTSFSQNSALHCQKILRRTFEIIQAALLKNAADAVLTSGACGAIALLYRDHAYIAHVGDCVIFRCQINETLDFELINKNLHRADNRKEVERIAQFLARQNVSAREKARIIAGLENPNDPRLGRLAITRALGDMEHEPLGLLHIPDETDIIMVPINPRKKTFIIVATDGLTEQLDAQSLKRVIETIDNPIAETISERLAKAAFDSGSTDNITVLVRAVHSEEQSACYLAAFDGHGGNVVAALCAAYLDDAITQAILEVR